MRIEQFELTRYGAFTDHIIDFGSADKAGDFHIVYGPNEAGKSTLREAVIDFLYGFPRQTPYNFIHANEALLLAATLTAGDETHQFVRVKRNKSSLLTSGNQPASEDVLKDVLGDINRASYANMFSLDEDTLEEGGESILRSEGDLGELLFAAASGLSSLSSRLDEIRADAATFYKKPGRSHRLAEMKRKLGDLRSLIREKDVPASQYDSLVKDEKSQRERHESAKSERDEKNARAVQLKVLLDCVDLWRDYHALSDDFATVKDAPDLPENWLDEAQLLATKSATGKTKFEEVSCAVEQGISALDAIEIDSSILALGARIERLVKDDNEAKFRTSKDILSRQGELSTLNDDMRGVLRRLGAQEAEDPESLLIPAATVGRIKELIEQLSGLKANATTASEEVERTQDKAEQAKSVLATFTDNVDLTALAETLATVRDDGDDRECTLLGKRCDALREELRIALATLAPWKGEASNLLTLPRPIQSTIDTLKREEDEVQESVLELSREADRLKDDQSRLIAEIEAEVSTAGVIEDAQAIKVRSVRDLAWQNHRDTFRDGQVAATTDLQSTADTFEATISEDDRVTQSRFLQTTEIAVVRKLRNDLVRCEAAITRNAEKHQALKTKQADFSNRVAEVAATLTLPKGTTVAFIETWLNNREDAIVKYHELEDTASQQEQLKNRIDEAKETLATVMTATSLDPGDLDWRKCIKRCENAIADWKREEAERLAAEKSVNETNLELKDRKRHQTKTQKALATWRASWTETLGSCWIGSGDHQATPAETQEILDTLDSLAIKLDKARELTTRIEAMQANRDAYEKDVTELAADAGETFDFENPLRTADSLRERYSKARENERRHKEKTREVAEAERRLDDVEVARELIETRFDEMATIFTGEDFETLITGMRRAEKKVSLQEQIDKLRRQLTSRLGISEFDKVESLLADKLSDPEALLAIQSEHDALVADSVDVNEHVSSLYHDWKKAETALAAIGDDSAVARLEEEVRVLLLDIRSEAERFVSLSAGVMLVDRALKSYLDTHRSSMMEKASEAFSAITRGAFSGLAAMPGKGSEVLVGLRHDGTSIIAPEMSRGTRFQLYLGLRIAGYREFIKHREPLPFFADDILETFDDDRSAETFSLMADMAKEGQVIYLTHHRHLCEIAKKICKEGVMVHELPDRAVHK